MPRAAPPGSRASPSAAATPVRRGMGKGRGEGRRVRGRGVASFYFMKRIDSSCRLIG